MNHSNAVDDTTVLRALRDCDEADRDGIGGGWRPEHVAAHCRLEPVTVADRLDDLVDKGLAVKVWGRGPDAPRMSWLPHTHEDAPDSEIDDGPECRVWIDEHDA